MTSKAKFDMEEQKEVETYQLLLLTLTTLECIWHIRNPLLHVSPLINLMIESSTQSLNEDGLD